MTEKEKTLLQTLYNFYSETSGKEIAAGDEVIIEKPGSKHHGKNGVVKDIRADGKIRISMESFILIANPQRVKKLGKPKNIERLFKILDQMVADGDLSKEANDKFLKAINLDKKRKEIDPYDEENWEDEDSFSLRKKPKVYKPSYSGC